MKKVFIIYCLAIVGILTAGQAEAQDNGIVTAKKVITLYPVEIVYPATQLLLYPNPANHFVEIMPDQVFNLEGFILQVFDDKGVMVVYKQWNGEKIDVSQFQSGIYIVTLRKGQQYYSQKLIVKRE